MHSLSWALFAKISGKCFAANSNFFIRWLKVNSPSLPQAIAAKVGIHAEDRFDLTFE